MITKEQALKLTHGDIIYDMYAKNRKGEPQRWRVNGMIKTWKTRPEEFRVPLKHGLYTYGELTHYNNHIFALTEEEVKDHQVGTEFIQERARRLNNLKKDEG